MGQIATDSRTFLPGVGFRRAGLRLARPASVTRDERVLTVLDVVATPEGTDLVFELTRLATDRYEGGPPPERVMLASEGARYGVGGGMSIAVREGKLVHTYTMVPIPLTGVPVELQLSTPYAGDWRVPLELARFPAAGEPTYAVIDASDTRHGITVTVRGIVARADLTAIDLMALSDRDLMLHGLGGFRMRDASTALTLRDDAGGVQVEHFRQDARDQLPDPTGISDVGIFDPLPAVSRRLVLEVPSVVYDDRAPTLDIDLPIAAPYEAEFAGRTIRLLSSESVTTRRGMQTDIPAVAIRVELGEVEDELCVIKPTSALADGEPVGIGYGGRGIHGPSPRPLEVIEIFRRGDADPQRVTLVGATIRARGPWRVAFDRPR